MNLNKMVEALTEIMRKQTQENALLRANNNKLDKLIKLQHDELDLLKCQKPVLNMDELCLYLGMSKNYVYKLTSNNILPYSKPFGKLIFFKRADVDEFMLRNPVMPTMTIAEFEVKAKAGLH